MPEPKSLSQPTCNPEYALQRPRVTARSFALLLRHVRETFSRCIDATFREKTRFRKYRVAPRLGTNLVRRRLLIGLNQLHE
jgi:hypothetical protein